MELELTKREKKQVWDGRTAEATREKNKEIAELRKTVQELRCLLAAEEGRLRAEKLKEEG